MLCPHILSFLIRRWREREQRAKQKLAARETEHGYHPSIVAASDSNRPNRNLRFKEQAEQSAEKLMSRSPQHQGKNRQHLSGMSEGWAQKWEKPESFMKTTHQRATDERESIPHHKSEEQSTEEELDNASEDSYWNPWEEPLTGLELKGVTSHSFMHHLAPIEH